MSNIVITYVHVLYLSTYHNWVVSLCLLKAMAVRALRENVKAVLIDLSGTIHIDDTEVQGSIKALSRFDYFQSVSQLPGISFNEFFVTNGI